MLPCSFYTQNYKLPNFQCPYERYNAPLKINLELRTQINKHCPYCFDCAKNTRTPFKRFVDKNTVINSFGGGRVELIRYKENFKVIDDHCNLKGETHPRKFIEIDNVLVPIRDDIRIDALQQTIFQSSKRAQDNFYGYALANTWQYFITLTFSKHKVNDRYNDDEVKALWSTFRKEVQKIDKKVKILAVPERHEDGALHFHALLSLSIELPIVMYDCDTKDFNTFDEYGQFTYLPKTKQKYYLLPYLEKGEWKKSSSGAELFCMNFWTVGRNTLAILPVEQNQEAVINYLITYTTKQSNVGYNKKRYYRTHNLNFKDKLVCIMSEEETAAISNQYNFKLFKENEKFTVYRNFNIKE